MTSYINWFLLILEIWMLASVVLVLHRFSAKIGLAPLFVFLGGITAALQLHSLGWLQVNLGWLELDLDSNTLLPILLFGLLIIYVIHGTQQARGVFMGMVFVTVIVAVLQFILSFQTMLPENTVLLASPIGYSPRILAASIIAFSVDLFILVIVYQASTNLRNRFPSRLAASIALLIALWSDALVFPAFAFGGGIAFGNELLAHLAGKTLAGVALIPFLSIYLFQVADKFPKTEAIKPRPTWDFLLPPFEIKFDEQDAIIQAAIGTMQDGLVISDLAGRILYVNSIVTEITGIPVDELLKLNTADLVQYEQAKLFPGFLKHLLKDGSVSIVFDLKSKDGRLLNIATNISLVRDENERPKHIVSSIRDVSTQRSYEHQLLILNQMTTDLVQIHDVKTMMEHILEISGEMFKADANAIYMVNAQTKKITDHLAHNLSEEYFQRVVENYSGLPVGTSWETQNPISIRDTLSDPNYGDQIHFMAVFGIRALLVLPIIFQDEPLGALIVYYHQPREFLPDEIQLGMTLSQTLAIIIQNARLYQSELENRKLIEALMSAATSLNSSLDLEEVVDEILEQAMKVVPCRGTNVMVIENETVSIVRSKGYEELAGSLQTAQDSRTLLSFPVIRLLLTEKKPILIADTSQSDIWQITPSTSWIRSYIGIPLVSNQQVIGILHASSDSANDFTPVMVENLASFGTHAVVAIQNARHYQAEQNQRELSDALTTATASLNSSLDFEDVLDQILEQVMRVVSCKAANILMIKDDYAYVGSHLGYEDMPAYLKTLDTIQVPLSTRNIQTMLAGQPYLIPNTLEDPFWQRFPGVEWIMGYAGVPLMVDDTVVGFINVDSDIPNFFSIETVTRLQIFSGHASTAIKNARFYAAITQRADEMAALANSAASISSSIKINEVIYVVAEQMCKTLNMQVCAISDYDRDENTLTLIAQYASEGWYIGDGWLAPLDLAKFPLYGQVLRLKTPFQLRVSEANPDESEHYYMLQTGIKSLLILPLIVHDQAIGLVELMDDERERLFSDHEMALGQTLASQAAVAIQNADLYRQQQDYSADLETRVLQRTTELGAAKEHIETILASVPDAVFVLDNARKLIQANQAGELLLRQAQTSGQDIFAPAFFEALAEEQTQETQTLIDVDGRVYQALSSRMAGKSEHSADQVIVFRDVTRFRELDQLKSQFISDVSHDLRTPLTNITLFLGLLELEQNFGKRQTYAEILQRETKRLTHLIDDLLAFSRIELGKIEPKLQAMDANQIVHQLTVDRAVFANQNKIRLTYNPQTKLPLVLGDPNWVTQTLSNLLNNAINYTQADGKIIIQTGVRARNHKTWVVIDVVDTGVGIAPDEITKIFDRFYRGMASQRTGAPGTGLGLAISKEMTQKMGGEITVQSKLDEGSTFTIWLRPSVVAIL